SYYKGGRMAVAFALHNFQHPNASRAMEKRVAGPTAAARITPDGKVEVRGGARSVAYSVAAYVFGAPNAQMWLLCAMQALAAGFLCAVTLLLFSRNARGPTWKLAGLALGTPIAFVVCLAIPDIFAGLVILAITLLTVAHDRMSRGVRS